MPAHEQIQETHEIVDLATVPDQRGIRELCRDYFDQEASHYDAYDSANQKRRLYTEAINAYVTRRLAGQPEIKLIVSFGCGTGRREEDILRRSSITSRITPRLIGIENSEKMAALAARRGITPVPDAETAITVAQSADVILCLSSFVHVPSHEARLSLLRNFYTMLSPGGLLIIDVFNINDRYEWGPALADRENENENGSIKPGDVFYRRMGSERISYMHYFSIAEIAGLLETAGFLITDLTGVGYAHRPGKVGVPLDQGCITLSCTKIASTSYYVPDEVKISMAGGSV